LTSIAALLLLLSGPNASADEEPAARAVPPPPLRSVPAEDRQIPEPSPGINQSSPLPSAMKLDGSNTAVSQGKPHRRSTPSGGVAVAKQQNAPARRSSRFTDATRVGKASDASHPEDDKGTGLRSASFHLRATFVRGPIAPPRQRSRQKAPGCIILVTRPVHPHMVTSRAILIHGNRQDLGCFGKSCFPNLGHRKRRILLFAVEEVNYR